MRFLAFILGLLGILALSVVLTPLIYEVTAFKFERILSRLIMILGLLWIFPFARKRLLDLGTLGLRFERRSLPLFLKGFLIGFSVLSFLTLTQVLLGVRSFSVTASVLKILTRVASYFCSAALIGLIEEYFFRGFVLTGLRGRITMWGSLFVTNFFYAMVHFLRSKEYIIPEHPTVVDSLWVLLYFLKPLTQVSEIGLTFLALFVFGLILSFAFLRVKSLFLPIGIHAGTVFLLKMDGLFFSGLQGDASRLFWGVNGYDGIIGFAFILLMGAGIAALTKQEGPAGRKSPPHDIFRKPSRPGVLSV